MQSRKYLLCAEWLNNIMIFMLWFIGTEWVCRLLRFETVPIHGLITGLILLCSYFSRVYIKKLLVYIGIHCLGFAALIFLPIGLEYKIAALIIFGIFSLCDLFFWTGEGVRSFAMVHPVAVIFILAVFAYGSWYDLAGLIRAAYICGILFMAMFFIRTYLLNAVKLAGDMLINSATPLEEMFRNNGRMVVLLVTFFTGSMFLVRSESLARGFKALLHLLYDLVRRLIIFIISLFGREGREVPVKGEAVPLEFDFSPVSNVPAWVTSFLQATEKVLAILILAFFLYSILRGIAAFLRIYFYRHGYDVRTRESDDHIDVDERIRHDRRRRNRRIFVATDERERVRRRYKKEVEALRRSGYILRRDHTPGERAADVLDGYENMSDHDFYKLTEKYEYYRYGKM